MMALIAETPNNGRINQINFYCHYRGLKPSPLGDCFSFQLYSMEH